MSDLVALPSLEAVEGVVLRDFVKDVIGALVPERHDEPWMHLISNAGYKGREICFEKSSHQGYALWSNHIPDLYLPYGQVRSTLGGHEASLIQVADANGLVWTYVLRDGEYIKYTTRKHDEITRVTAEEALQAVTNWYTYVLGRTGAV